MLVMIRSARMNASVGYRFTHIFPSNQEGDICLICVNFLVSIHPTFQQLTRTAIISKGLDTKAKGLSLNPLKSTGTAAHLARSVTALTCVLGPSTCPRVCHGRSGGGGADREAEGILQWLTDKIHRTDDRVDRLYAQSRTYVINSVKLEELWVSLGEEASAGEDGWGPSGEGVCRRGGGCFRVRVSARGIATKG